MQVEGRKLLSAWFSVAVTNILFLCVYTGAQHSAMLLYFLPSLFSIKFNFSIIIFYKKKKSGAKKVN